MKIAEQIARLTIKKDEFIKNISKTLNLFAEQQVEDDRVFNKFNELFNRELIKIMPTEFENVIQIIIDAIEQTYTKSEQKFLLNLYESQPWILEKAKISAELTTKAHIEIGQNTAKIIMEKIEPELEKFMEENELEDDELDDELDDVNWWKKGRNNA